MAAGPATQISDIIVPEIFTPYVQQLTEQKRSNEKLGNTVPSMQDLDDDADRVSTDTSAVFAAADASIPAGQARDPNPLKINSSQEVAVRLSRNNSWSSTDLTAALAGEDPMNAIGSRVAFYWTRRLQAAFIATINGVIADNTANDAGDYTNDISGASFTDGVTNFSAEAFLDAAVTMGDSMEDLTMVMMHSVVYNRAQKNNLIDFIPDARGEVQIPTFLGREVIVDDGVPRTGNVYDTWLFGAGAALYGTGSPKVPTEVQRQPGAGNGGGQEVLYNRVEWAIHPVGHAYTGTAPNGGPGNGTGANELNNAASWDRVYPERKQIKFARLVTREA